MLPDRVSNPGPLTLTESVNEDRRKNRKPHTMHCIVEDLVGLLFLGLTALCDSISVYIGPPPREREKEEKR